MALLHGVTGSGKTEVYLRLAEAVRKRGRGVLMLVPEIALTPQVAALFRARFGAAVAIQHSGLSDGERHDQWHRIRRGDVDVVIGTRSAVFAPLHEPGLIIVDEEHDTSYKQDETPRYHGRDVAIMRGKFADALVVLGSATPTIESYANALDGKYTLVRRCRSACSIVRSPSVTVVNMRDEIADAGDDVVLSRPLASAMRSGSSGRSSRSILLNRRGFATSVICRQCSARARLPELQHLADGSSTGLSPSAQREGGARRPLSLLQLSASSCRRRVRSARRRTWSASASAPSASKRKCAKAFPDGARRPRRSRHRAAQGQPGRDARRGSPAARWTS